MEMKEIGPGAQSAPPPLLRSATGDIDDMNLQSQQ